MGSKKLTKILLSVVFVLFLLLVMLVFFANQNGLLFTNNVPTTVSDESDNSNYTYCYISELEDTSAKKIKCDADYFINDSEYDYDIIKNLVSLDPEIITLKAGESLEIESNVNYYTSLNSSNETLTLEEAFDKNSKLGDLEILKIKNDYFDNYDLSVSSSETSIGFSNLKTDNVNSVIFNTTSLKNILKIENDVDKNILLIIKLNDKFDVKLVPTKSTVLSPIVISDLSPSDELSLYYRTLTNEEILSSENVFKVSNIEDLQIGSKTNFDLIDLVYNDLEYPLYFTYRFASIDSTISIDPNTMVNMKIDGEATLIKNN